MSEQATEAKTPPKLKTPHLHLATGCCPEFSLCGGRIGTIRGYAENSEEAAKKTDCVVCADLARCADNCPHCGRSLWVDV